MYTPKLLQTFFRWLLVKVCFQVIQQFLGIDLGQITFWLQYLNFFLGFFQVFCLRSIYLFSSFQVMIQVKLHLGFSTLIFLGLFRFFFKVYLPIQQFLGIDLGQITFSFQYLNFFQVFFRFFFKVYLPIQTKQVPKAMPK